MLISRPFTLLAVIFLFVSTQAQDGIDYLDIQDSLTRLSCGTISDDDLLNAKTNLENFDISCVSQNADLYYKNLGYCYYIYYGKTNDTSYLKKAIRSYTKGLEVNPKSSLLWWDLGIAHYFDKNYAATLVDLEMYKEHTPRKYFQRKEYKNMKKYCAEKLALIHSNSTLK